jgi:hypothetical protein
MTEELGYAIDSRSPHSRPPSVYPAPTPSYVLASWPSSARENRTTGIKMVMTCATFFT